MTRLPCGNRKVGWLAASALFALAGCEGPQSTLDPAGHEAEQLADLFWWMAGGAAVIWLAVIAVAIYAIRVRAGSEGRYAAYLIIGGGAIVPTVVLTVLLIYGLALLPGLTAPAPEGSLTVSVSGNQWWWRVRYELPEGESVELANEIRLPVGEPVEFRLDSTDVIHSFWVPSLAGKMDMIPGRRTRLAFRPTRTGTFRGVCAEYCGSSHALMAFSVVVQERDEFDRWLANQASPARAPVAPLAVRGQELFQVHGCSACHTIRGTVADGQVGPDLTHVGSRISLGAGILPNTQPAFRHWIAHTRSIKPGVRMPPFAMLPSQDLDALAAYLSELQ